MMKGFAAAFSSLPLLLLLLLETTTHTTAALGSEASTSANAKPTSIVFIIVDDVYEINTFDVFLRWFAEWHSG